jgi:hypothetical protein
MAQTTELSSGIPARISIAGEPIPIPSHAELLASCAERIFDRMRPSSRTFAQKSEPSDLSAAVASGEDIDTDISFFVRGLPQIGSNMLDGTLGNSTGINMFLGLNGCLKASKRVLHAQKVGYTEGEVLAQVDRAGRAVQCVGGGIYFGVRGLTLASYVKNVDTSSISAPTLLGRVTFVLSTLGAALWGLFYALLGAMCAIDIYNGHKFRSEMEEAYKPGDDQLIRVVRFLEKWSIPVLDQDALEQEIRSENSEEQLVQKGLAHGSEILKQLMNEAGLEEISAEEREQLVREVIAHLGADVDEELENLGLNLEVAKKDARRHLELTSVTNAACAKKLENVGKQLRERHAETGLSLSERLEAGEEAAIEEAEAIVASSLPVINKIEKVMDEKFWINLGYLIACFIGVLATIGAFVLTGGIGPLVVAIAFIVVCSLMIMLDGYLLHQALKDSTPGKFDTTMLTISNVVSLLSFGASFTLIGILSLGIVPLITALVIAGIWLGVNAHVWNTILRNERDHPSLQQFLELLDHEKDHARLIKLFRNLPKVDQQTIAVTLADALFEEDEPRLERIAKGREIFHLNPTGKAVKEAVQARIAQLNHRAEERAAVQIQQAHSVLPFFQSI